MRDIFSPLVMELHYELGGQHREGAPSLILPPLTPILQRGEEQRNQLTNQVGARQPFHHSGRQEQYRQLINWMGAIQEDGQLGRECSVALQC